MVENQKKRDKVTTHHEEGDRKKKVEEVDYDTILSAAGECGLYQITLAFSTSPFYIFGAFVYFGQLFMTEPSPHHWCWVPELENLTDIERRTIAVPLDENTHFGYSNCKVYDVNWTEELLSGLKPNSSWPVTSCQHGWEFNKTEIPYPTTSSEMNWVCENSSNQATAQSVFFVGSIVGGFILGWVADRYGRLPATTCSNMVGCIAGVASTFTYSFWGFTICRFFVGIAYDNCMMMMYLLVLEYAGPKYRTIITNIPMAIFFTLGLSILPWIALACQHWRTLGLATSIPLALSLLAPFIIPESPRWLMSKGRLDDTAAKLLRIAHVNKKYVPPETLEQFKKTAALEKNIESANILEILKRPLLCKMFLLICLVYMSAMIVFDISARTLGQLGYDFFLSFTLVSLTELPSLILLSFILDYTGRRWLSIIAFMTSAVFSFLTAFAPAGILSVLSAMVLRFCVNMAGNTGIQWAAELMPTPVRGSCASIVHICGYIATVISPFIAYSSVKAYWLPLVITGSVAALAVLLSFLLPETANKTLPQTFEDAENMFRKQRLWEFPWSKPQSDEKGNVEGHVNSSFELS